MKERGRYDYDDMIIWCAGMRFVKMKNCCAVTRSVFNIFLVDEFQDTSGSQNELLKFILNYWDTPNVFVVGDDDQSDL